MSPMRSAIIALLGAALLVLAGCSGPGGGSSSGKGGGYYKDDGPGGNIPADIEAIPNATPRIEKHAKANFRPYVVFGKRRSEEHTSELQSLMRNTYAVFCLKKKK